EGVNLSVDSGVGGSLLPLCHVLLAVLGGDLVEVGHHDELLEPAERASVLVVRALPFIHPGVVSEVLLDGLPDLAPCLHRLTCDELLDPLIHERLCMAPTGGAQRLPVPSAIDRAIDVPMASAFAQRKPNAVHGLPPDHDQMGCGHLKVTWGAPSRLSR